MININAGILFLLTLCSLSSYCQSNEPKGKLFIIGGGDRTPEMVLRMVQESGLDKGGYAVVLPMSSEEQDSAFYYTQINFTEAGYNNIYPIYCKREQANSVGKVDSILNAKLIYITGGDQNRFMEIVDGSAVLKAIRAAYQKGSMVGGTSAGAALMSQKMITGNSLKNIEYESTFNIIESNNIEIKEGLGLLKNGIVDQHFVARSRHNRLISAIIEFPELKGIGIDESTAILVKGNDAEVVGISQVLVYENVFKSKTEKNGKLAAKGITLNIYLAGDHFSLK